MNRQQSSEQTCLLSNQLSFHRIASSKSTMLQANGLSLPIAQTWSLCVSCLVVFLTGRQYTGKHSSKNSFRHHRKYLLIHQRCLKPGGWLEHHEVGPDPHSEDDSVPPDHPFGRWGSLIFQAGDNIGKTYRTAYSIKEWMEEAGFVNVVEKKYKFPIGRWPADPRMKELGMWFRAYFEDGMEGYAMALLTRVLNVSCIPLFYSAPAWIAG
jgi:hypothetical protein